MGNEIIGQEGRGYKLKERYRCSEEMLDRALAVIPLGSQTFSKSKTQFPQGVSPFFIERGLGSKVWDVDGNEYIDFISGLAAITLGYNDPDVNAAVKAQLQKGSIFSLAHRLEIEVAEKIVEMVPCAEMVRFGKNGSDATSGSIRLARAYTGRENIAACGYHGWQDWYIGSTTRNKGVPKAVQGLTHTFKYNDLQSLETIFKKKPGQIAAVIMEPVCVEEPQDYFLERVKSLAHKNGALLIFDETITGFRLAKGGAQELYKVIPDIATFGKGLANGFPLSALAGKKEIMEMMEEIFFSFTFGGETLSLAASLATLKKLQTEPVIEHLYSLGQMIVEQVTELIKKYDMNEYLAIRGNPTMPLLIFRDTPKYSQPQLKTLFMQEAFARGILTIGTNTLSYAHSKKDIEKLTLVYDEVFSIISRGINEGKIENLLKCTPLVPLFKVR